MGDPAGDGVGAGSRAHGYPATDIDGVEALTQLRADERTASIPVLARTAEAMHGDRERFLAAGFDGYVSKPVNIVELLGTIRRHCDGRDP